MKRFECFDETWRSKKQEKEGAGGAWQRPDFGGELDPGLDDEGFLRMCRHTGLLLHHEGPEHKTHFHQFSL